MVRRTFIFLVSLIVLLVGQRSAQAFSVAGAQPDWQILRIGYADGSAVGPVNINEEHRVNLPLMYYGFTHAFQTYFGQRGIDEIEKAFQVFSDIPALSTVSPDDYPLNTQRNSFRAQRLGLLDLKSMTMQSIALHLGLWSPIDSIFTLRVRWTPNNTTNYLVIRRNFDPITKDPSSYVNGNLYTFSGILDGDVSSVVVVNPVDPLARNVPVASFGASTGTFYTGLTRDDIGGLKHIYETGNYNVEPANTNAFGLGVGGAVVSVAGGSAWATPVFTNLTSFGGGTGAWGTPVFTNATGTGTTDPNAGGGGTPAAPAVGTGNTNFFNVGLRPGINKLNFRRIGFDSVIGAFIATNVTYTDTVIVNGRLLNQQLGRVLPSPDFLIHAGDLTGGATDDPPTRSPMATFIDIKNNTSLVHDFQLSVGGDVGTSVDVNDGPGSIESHVFVYNTVGLNYFSSWPNFLSEADSSPSFIWGSFDGSTNSPVVYPHAVSVDEIEDTILGRR